MIDKVEVLIDKYNKLKKSLEDTKNIEDYNKFSKINKEIKSLESIVTLYKCRCKIIEEIENNKKLLNEENDVDFKHAEKMLNKLAKIVLKKGMPEGIDLLNVNIPENPVDDEFEVVKLGKRMYVPVMEKRLDPRGQPYYWIGGEPYNSDEKGSDCYELKVSQKTTITPLKIDLTGDLKVLKDYLDMQ